MISFTPCEKCKDSGAPPGFLYVRSPQGMAIKECECHALWKRRERLKLEAKDANLWSTDEILSYDPLKDYIGGESKKNVLNLQKYIDNFDQPAFKEASLYMWGPNGSQKTFLAQWVGISLLKKKKTVQFLLMNQLLTTLSSSFDSNPELQKFKERMLNVDLLILDECFSRDKVTLYKSGFQLPFLDSFLRERCDTDKKGILFVSNRSPLQIADEGFSSSIQDFVIRKTKPLNSIFEMKDVYMKLKTSFDVTTLFD